MNVEVNVKDRILKPLKDVFAAIVDPAKMSGYFISSGSAPMKTGTMVKWDFSDGDEQMSQTECFRNLKRKQRQHGACWRWPTQIIWLRFQDPTSLTKTKESKHSSLSGTKACGAQYYFNALANPLLVQP